MGKRLADKQLSRADVEASDSDEEVRPFRCLIITQHANGSEASEDETPDQIAQRK